MFTRTTMVAVILGFAALGTTVVALADDGVTRSGVISTETLVPMGLLVVLVGGAVTATWKVSRFVDRAIHAFEKMEKVVNKLEDLEERIEALEK